MVAERSGAATGTRARWVGVKPNGENPREMRNPHPDERTIFQVEQVRRCRAVGSYRFERQGKMFPGGTPHARNRSHAAEQFLAYCCNTAENQLFTKEE